jgi:hypothetical protein
MSPTDQFWQYVEEAMRSAYQAKTDKDKQAMLDLAHIWAQAALQSESNAGGCLSGLCCGAASRALDAAAVRRAPATCGVRCGSLL